MVLDTVLKDLYPALSTLSAHLANLVKAYILFFVVLNIQESSCANLYAFSISGKRLKSSAALSFCSDVQLCSLL